MSDNFLFLVLEKTCDDAVEWFSEQVAQKGLRVVRTFDLKDARHANVDCPCPHHNTAQCDCQMVVLLVFQTGHQPISIVAHGYNGQTWFSVVDNPQQRADPRIEEAIRMVLIPHIAATQLNQASQSHAG
ncbi:MAG: hypothetical protein A2032_05085 [Chloroflexi bacterium RBG_19FT_COMBO_49_13]|nr:MAG: hypothetical protein A2Y53_04060 [Chloroflexi bacterium RBG_16_47_49]OGO62178.1 MAG: hypothetical protein A2032_05085 [Chloroflexi bacterium RBG_19FT_COMBO_49_13]